MCYLTRGSYRVHPSHTVYPPTSLLAICATAQSGFIHPVKLILGNSFECTVSLLDLAPAHKKNVFLREITDSCWQSFRDKRYISYSCGFLFIVQSTYPLHMAPYGGKSCEASCLIMLYKTRNTAGQSAIHIHNSNNTPLTLESVPHLYTPRDVFYTSFSPLRNCLYFFLTTCSD